MKKPTYKFLSNLSPHELRELVVDLRGAFETDKKCRKHSDRIIDTVMAAALDMKRTKALACKKAAC